MATSADTRRHKCRSLCNGRNRRRHLSLPARWTYQGVHPAKIAVGALSPSQTGFSVRQSPVWNSSAEPPRKLSPDGDALPPGLLHFLGHRLFFNSHHYFTSGEARIASGCLDNLRSVAELLLSFRFVSSKIFQLQHSVADQAPSMNCRNGAADGLLGDGVGIDGSTLILASHPAPTASPSPRAIGAC